MKGRGGEKSVTPSPPHSFTSSRIIRASEIGQYKYCARAWWLGSVMNVQSANVREMAQGEAMHKQHGQTVWWAGALRVLAVLLVVAAVLALVVGLL